MFIDSFIFTTRKEKLFHEYNLDSVLIEWDFFFFFMQAFQYLEHNFLLKCES